jgi:DUF4097 and DUF4098 domain-containing protein YvlB
MRVAGFVGLALVALVASPARGDEWTHQYPLKGRPDVHVKADDASVRVETGTAGQVDARVTTKGWRIGSGEVTVTESQTGNRVDLEVRRPKGNGFGTSNRSIEIVLQMPKEADLEVNTGDGSITVQPLTGKVNLSTGDGSISAEGLQGEVRLHTGDGSIRASGLSGRLKGDTGDGSMTVRGRFDVLDLRTGDGSIGATAEAGSKVEAAWSLRSGDGSITLHLPEGLGADLDAQTGDGSISVDKSLGVSVSGTIRERSVRGPLGPGGPPLQIYTGDGSIRLSGL